MVVALKEVFKFFSRLLIAVLMIVNIFARSEALLKSSVAFVVTPTVLREDAKAVFACVAVMLR